VQSAVTAALAKVAKVPGIENVASPYAKNGAAQISRDVFSWLRPDLRRAASIKGLVTAAGPG
jgi:hypothetical protein